MLDARKKLAAAGFAALLALGAAACEADGTDPGIQEPVIPEDDGATDDGGTTG